MEKSELTRTYSDPFGTSEKIRRKVTVRKCHQNALRQYYENEKRGKIETTEITLETVKMVTTPVVPLCPMCKLPLTVCFQNRQRKERTKSQS